MKVVISTFFQGTHVGAVLQAYALVRVLMNSGCTVELLRYRPKPTLGLATRVRQRLLDVLSGKHSLLRGYNEFRNRFIPQTSRAYSTLVELEADPPRADVYVCGSDQIWNPRILPGGRFDPAYFLSFAPQGTKKIAYAASMGGYVPNYQERDFLERVLGDFAAVSVRERAAQEVVAPLVPFAVETCLDPTLLVSNYNEILTESTDDADYVVVYALSLTPAVKQAASKVSKHLGVPIRTLSNSRFSRNILGSRMPARDPAEWLQAIRGAAAVITNSFHGLAFSILFQKKVAIVPWDQPFEKRNDRLIQLCDFLGMRSSILQADEQAAGISEPDWAEVSSRLTRRRADSLDFLMSALKAASDAEA